MFRNSDKNPVGSFYGHRIKSRFVAHEWDVTGASYGTASSPFSSTGQREKSIEYPVRGFGYEENLLASRRTAAVIAYSAIRGNWKLQFQARFESFKAQFSITRSLICAIDNVGIRFVFFGFYCLVFNNLKYGLYLTKLFSFYYYMLVIPLLCLYVLSKVLNYCKNKNF